MRAGNGEQGTGIFINDLGLLYVENGGDGEVVSPAPCGETALQAVRPVLFA